MFPPSLSELTNCTLSVGGPTARDPEPDRRGDHGDGDRPQVADADHMVGFTCELTKTAADGSSVTAKMSEYKVASACHRERRWDEQNGDFGFGVTTRWKPLTDPGEFWCEEFGYYNLDQTGQVVDVERGHGLLRAFTASPLPPPPHPTWGPTPWGGFSSTWTPPLPHIGPPPTRSPPSTPPRPPTPVWDRISRQWVDEHGWPIAYDAGRF